MECTVEEGIRGITGKKRFLGQVFKNKKELATGEKCESYSRQSVLGSKFYRIPTSSM
jgi:hypothetical protein